MIRAKIKQCTPIPLWQALAMAKYNLTVLSYVFLLKMSGSNFKSFRYIAKNKCKEITWLDLLLPEFIFKQSEEISIYQPREDTETQNSFIVQRPNICLYKFRSAKVHVHSSHILLKDSIIMERLVHVPLEYCNYSTGFVANHNSEFSANKTNYSLVSIDKAFFLGGNGSFNYYHWSIEIATKLKYFLSLENIDKDIKIIIPDCAKEIESFSLILEILLGKRFDFIYASKNQIIQAENLYVITSPSNVVFNTRKNTNFGVDFLYFDKASIDFLRDSILYSPQYNHFLEKNNNVPINKKIFLARKEQLFRKYNQKEVIDLVTDYGFSTIFLEDLSFFEQVYMFQNVEFLIGASGAAWTNLIYVSKRTKAISWLGKNVDSFSSYSTLAKYYDCNLVFFKCKVFNQKNVHSDYNVDLQLLENLIKKLVS